MGIILVLLAEIYITKELCALLCKKKKKKKKKKAEIYIYH